MEYRVNDKTLAVLPKKKKKSRILENNKNYDLNISTHKVIEHSCEYFGVSYNSRVEGSSKFIKSRYKTPIIIEETSRLVFFPINSPTKKNALWVSYNNISEYFPCKNQRHTIIKFKNGYKMEVDVSFYSFNQQFLKASRLSAVLNDRILDK